MGKKIGDRIAFARGQQGLTQARLDDLVGVARGTVQHYENHRRRPSAGNLLRLARTLGCTSDWLLEGTEEPSL